MAEPGKVITSVKASPFTSVPTIVTVLDPSPDPEVVAVIFLGTSA